EPESATMTSGRRSTPTQKLDASMGVNPKWPVGVSTFSVLRFVDPLLLADGADTVTVDMEKPPYKRQKASGPPRLFSRCLPHAFSTLTRLADGFGLKK